jgi:hypothetical protein
MSTERVSDERLRELIEQARKYLHDDFRDALRELTTAREELARLRAFLLELRNGPVKLMYLDDRIDAALRGKGEG